MAEKAIYSFETQGNRGTVGRDEGERGAPHGHAVRDRSGGTKGLSCRDRRTGENINCQALTTTDLFIRSCAEILRRGRENTRDTEKQSGN